MSEIANSGRERILANIRNALKTPRPGVGAPHPENVFPPVGNLLERFQVECKGNLTECVFADGDVRERLHSLLEELPAGEIFAEDTLEFRSLLNGLHREVKWSSDGPPAESSLATITTAHALIAQTGSLLVSSLCGGRGASVIAPVHIVVTGASQLVADLGAALELAQQQQLPQRNSFIGVITGCSRTGDIEKLLVIGAHGPKRLVVLLDRNK